MSSSSSRVLVKLRTPQGPLELRLYDHRHQLVDKGFGAVERRVTPGLYRLEIDAGPATEERYLTVGASGLVKEDLTIAIPSAAPVRGTSTVHEYHAYPAQRLSLLPHVSLGQGGRIVVFVRSMDGDQRRPVAMQPLSLVDSQQKTLAGGGAAAFEENPAEGWAGFSANVAPGGYAVRLQRPQRTRHASTGEAETIDQSVWVEPGWTTLVFVPFRSQVGCPEPGFASIHMARISEGFQPYEDRQGANLALEVALSGLRQGRAAVPRRLEELMLEAKFVNPMLGIVGALVLLQEEATNWRLFDTVRGNLKRLVPHHPDLSALHVMGKRKRADDSESRIPAAAWPPMLYACYRAIIDRDTLERRRIVVADSVADLAAPRLLAQGPWTQWRAFDTQPSAQRQEDLAQRLSQVLAQVHGVVAPLASGTSGDKLYTAWAKAIALAETPPPTALTRRSSSGASEPAAGFEPAASTLEIPGGATPEELRVASYLQAVAAQAAEFDLPVDESAFEVKALGHRVGLPRATVQRALKGLARKGLVPGG